MGTLGRRRWDRKIKFIILLFKRFIGAKVPYTNDQPKDKFVLSSPKNNVFRVAFEPIALFCTNMQDFMLIPNLLKLAQKCSGKKLSGKNYANLCCKDFDFFPFLHATFSEHF